MSMKRSTIHIVITILLALTLVAGIILLAVSCESGPADEPHDSVDSGVVIERSRRVVIVREDDGERDKHSIHKRSTKCPVGSRWPDCKK